jgi:hypothetical protein
MLKNNQCLAQHRAANSIPLNEISLGREWSSPLQLLSSNRIHESIDVLIPLAPWNQLRAFHFHIHL